MDSIVGMKQIGTMDDHQDLLVKSIGNGEKHFALESQNSQTHFYLSRGQTHALIHALSDGQGTIDADNLRGQVYSAEGQVQRAIDALAPIHHDSVLRQVMIDLNTAMDAILEIREMLPDLEAK